MNDPNWTQRELELAAQIAAQQVAMARTFDTASPSVKNKIRDLAQKYSAFNTKDVEREELRRKAIEILESNGFINWAANRAWENVISGFFDKAVFLK